MQRQSLLAGNFPQVQPWMGAGRRGAGASGQPSVPSNPIVAILGASRFAHNDKGASNILWTNQNGFFEWAKVLTNRFRLPSWYDARADKRANNNSMQGMVFALDGNGFTEMLQRVPKIKASKANVIIINSALSGIQGGVTVNDYCTTFEQIIELFYGQTNGIGERFFVIVDNLWERGVNSGGVWLSGGQGRVQTPQINAQMVTYCAAKNIPIVDLRSALINFADADKNPVQAYVMGDPTVSGIDGTHQSNIGGYVGGSVAVVPIINALFPAVSLPDPYRTGNLFTNAAFSGTGGTVGAGGSGTLPNGLVFARSGSNVTSVFSMVTEAPADTARFGSTPVTKLVWELDNADLLSGSTIEGGLITISLTGLTAATWIEAGATFEVSASAVEAGCYIRFTDSASHQANAINPTDNGSALVNGIFNTANLQPTTPDAWTGRAVTQPVQSTGTTGTLIFPHGVRAGAAGVKAIVKIWGIDVRTIADPNLLMYDETNLTVAAFTSADNVSADEEIAGSFTVTTTVPCSFAQPTGADGAKFTLDNFGRLAWAALDFEIPTDADANNIYVITITATPYDLTKAAITQTFSLTVLNVNDGYTDTFTGVAGTDLAVYSANWTRIDGFVNSINISAGGNTAVNNLSSGGTTAYSAPQQGSTQDQQITYQPTSTSSKMTLCALVVNKDNWIGLVDNGTDMLIRFRIAGVTTRTVTISGTTDMYKAKAANDSWTMRIYQGSIYVYQKGVKVKTDLNTPELLASPFAAALLSGIVSNTGAGTNNAIDNWNNRVSPAVYGELVGLRAITVLPTTGTAATQYIGLLSGYTAGGTITISSVKKGGVDSTEEWIADGSQIRGTSPTAGTWTIVIAEGYPGAVNDGRTSSLTITIS